MKKLGFVLLSITALLMSMTQADYLGKNKYGMDIFSVNLDLPEEQRFVEVATYYKPYLLEVLNQYMDLIPAPLLWFVEQFSGYIYAIHPEYYLEIQGMAKAIGINTNSLLFAQYINEFSAFCTSVIGYTNNGTIFHGRNMDFLFESTMRNITYQAEFMQNGKYLYTAVMYAGLNGVPTGWRDGWSISINNRKPSNRTSIIDLVQNIALVFAGFTQNMKLIRDTLQTCATYDCAFNKLSTTP